MEAEVSVAGDGVNEEALGTAIPALFVTSLSLSLSLCFFCRCSLRIQSMILCSPSPGTSAPENTTAAAPSGPRQKGSVASLCAIPIYYIHMYR